MLPRKSKKAHMLAKGRHDGVADDILRRHHDVVVALIHLHMHENVTMFCV